MKSDAKVIIGWVSNGQVDSMFAMRLAGLFGERRDRIADLLTREESGLLSRGRNQLVADFLAIPSGADWLLMLDADQQLMLDGFDKLIAAAHHAERPIVSGLYFGAWATQFYPVAVPMIFHAMPGTNRFRPVEGYERDAVIPIDSAGAGCLLVHRSVLERIAEDATDQTTAHFEDGTSQVRWAWFRDGPVDGDWFSEDHYFCAQARQAGFKLHAHTGVVLPHRKSFWLGESHYLMGAHRA